MTRRKIIWVGGTPTAPPAGDSFVLGTTQPDASNTGLAGYQTINGTKPRTSRTGTVTLTAGQTLADCDVTGQINITGSNVTVRNCSVTQPSGFSWTGITGLIQAIASGTTNILIEFCDIYQQPNTGLFWLNGIHGARNGSQVTVSRNNIGHVPDGFYGGDTSSGGKLFAYGNYIHDRAFFSTSTDHTGPNDAPHYYWEHMDCIQIMGGSNGHTIIGNTLYANMSHTVGCITRLSGYVVDAYGSSVFDAETTRGGWAAGLTISPPTGVAVTNMLVQQNWFDYGQASIQMNSANGGVAAVGTFGGTGGLGNRFGYGQGNWSTTPGVTDNYQIRYNTGLTFAQELTNYFDPNADTVPLDKKGDFFVVGGAGAGIRRN